ncbi:MAG TPA: hypothetical protein VM100_03745 [Longimicrobiales bacterium]|nr:hypothetical protein [Longimicrobiales bacterium]
MSTLFTRILIISVILGGCSRASLRRVTGVPAPAAEADSADSRSWKSIRVSGSYGSFDMLVPTLTLSSTDAVMIDSVAMQEVEKRLTARVGRIARSEAESLFSSQKSSRLADADIKTNLLGTIEFDEDSVVLNSVANARVNAVGKIAAQLNGTLEVLTTAQGTGAAQFDVALARARRVYLTLVAGNPALGERPVHLTIKTRTIPLGAPRVTPTVEVYIRP